MKLAVLGTDADMLTLVGAALAAGHQITWLGDVRREDTPTLQQLVPGLTASNEWESLLDHGLVDAILVGRGTVTDDMKAEQLKRFVADAVPTLIVHPATLSVLPFYELDMGRRESHAVVRHFNPLVGNPALAEMASWLKTGDSEIGPVHQVVCQRFTTDCDRETVLRHLARDVELLRTIVGQIRSVGAVGPRAAGRNIRFASSPTVGTASTTFRWSVVPSPAATSRVEITLIGERGTATLRLPPDRSPSDFAERDDVGKLEIDVAGHQQLQPLPSWNAARVAVDALAAALPANGTAQSDSASTWQSATASMEVVDAIELSLQKGRTIEVYPQQLTEQLAFRGTMAAFGCGLLLMGLFVLAIAGILGDALNVPLMHYWPWALLAVLAIFLLLQTVPWLASKRRGQHSPESATLESEP